MNKYVKPQLNYLTSKIINNVQVKMSGGIGSILLGIRLSVIDLNIEVNETFQLEAISVTGIYLYYPDISWISNNISIATINQEGIITANSIGQTTVKACYSGLWGTSYRVCNITVSDISTEKTIFINNLETLMGFLQVDAMSLAMIYRFLLEKYDSYYYAAVKFFNIIASGQYSDSETGLLFGIVGGFSLEESESELLEIGYSYQFIDNILGYIVEPGIVHEQHLLCYDNEQYIDFAHLAATISTILVRNLGDYLGFFSGVFNGDFNADDNAGYIGDVCGTNYTGPAMDNPDYKSDLDAVNIAVRILNSEQSLFTIMNDYYEGLDNYSRAEEFLDNIPIETLAEQFDRFAVYLRHKGEVLGKFNDENTEYVIENIRIFRLFINNLLNHNNDWDPGLI